MVSQHGLNFLYSIIFSAELETTEILREYGLKSQEEVQRERLEAAAEERRKRLEGEVPPERLAAQ
jgi:hypothetical protein